MLNGMGSARPLYPSSNDPDLRNGSPRYIAAGTNSCPPPHILEKHFSSPIEELHPRFNAVRTQFTFCQFANLFVPCSPSLGEEAKKCSKGEELFCCFPTFL